MKHLYGLILVRIKYFYCNYNKNAGFFKTVGILQEKEIEKAGFSSECRGGINADYCATYQFGISWRYTSHFWCLCFFVINHLKKVPRKKPLAIKVRGFTLFIFQYLFNSFFRFKHINSISHRSKLKSFDRICCLWITVAIYPIEFC